MFVTFCGHRVFVKSVCVEKALTALLEDYARKNKKLICYNGGYGKFDYFAAACVEKLQIRYMNICNCLVIPYIYPQFLEGISKIKNHFNETIYPPLENVHKKYAIIRRNEWMIDHADVLIACVHSSWGGAAQTLTYAKRKNKIIEYLP